MMAESLDAQPLDMAFHMVRVLVEELFLDPSRNDWGFFFAFESKTRMETQFQLCGKAEANLPPIRIGDACVARPVVKSTST